MRRTDASLAAMALLAASVQGTILTLSTVEMITSFAVPLSCIFAYNTPISGCETSDFTSGRCSPGCQRELLRVQTNIQASCKGKSGECALQPRAATSKYNSYAVVSGDVIKDFGTLHHCYRFRLLYHVFENAVIHSNDVLSHTDDHTDDHTNNHTDDNTDDYVDNTAHSQLDVDRVQL
ncbi:hypothetical protein BBO_01912 [Beauveria brongniartii RCEF 3172]|uniref:Uncharacterized protein n=1 Tax=Beauveria brongniartii RCEF 3172 TaxID=1081107 RepID=A0A167IAW2_9HYPO|nr:hypothetical protein BBO_01912 [Beauveria brongniartii RCEF 3172]